MKYGLMILILTLSWGYSQCDANDDGDLNVLDVVINVAWIFQRFGIWLIYLSFFSTS